MGEMKTLYGQLYAHSAEETSNWGWMHLDDVLFGGGHKYFSGHLGNSIESVAIKMVEEQFNLPLTNVWRVHILNDGLVELNDFTLPSSTGRMRDTFKQENLPQWIQDSLSILMIVDQGVTVEGVGKKISDSIFYLMETPEIGEVYGSKT
jgi:hypothetical protein